MRISTLNDNLSNYDTLYNLLYLQIRLFSKKTINFGTKYSNSERRNYEKEYHNLNCDNYDTIAFYALIVPAKGHR